MTLLKDLFNINEARTTAKPTKEAIKLDGLKDKKKVHFKDRPYFEEPKEPLTQGGNVVIKQTKSGDLAGTMTAESKITTFKAFLQSKDE